MGDFKVKYNLGYKPPKKKIRRKIGGFKVETIRTDVEFPIYVLLLMSPRNNYP